MACGQVARRGLLKLRPLASTAVDDERAAGMKGATLGDIRSVGDLAGMPLPKLHAVGNCPDEAVGGVWQG